MRKIILTLLFVTLSAQIFAQIEGDSVPQINNPAEENKEYLNYLMRDEPALDYSNIPAELLYPSLQKTNLEKLFDGYIHTPQVEVPTTQSESRNPYVNDYSVNKLYVLSSKTYVTTSSSRETMPSLGAARTVDVGIGYKVTDWMSIGGGIYVAKYNSPLLSDFGPSKIHQNAIGFNANMNFKLTDRILLRTFGQYSPNSKYGVYGLSPTTSFGGALEFKISDAFGIGAGAEREFNPMTRKWTTKPIIYPIFYSK